MGFLQRINAWLSAPVSNRALSFETVFGHDVPRDEITRVTVDSARRSMAVWACQSLISGDLANLPFQAYRKVDDVRRSLTPTPSWIDEPNPLNPNFTGISYRRQVGLSEMQDGNAFIAVYPDVFDPVRLLVLNPTQCRITDGDGSPMYEVVNNRGGQLAVLSPFQLIHIPFFLPPGATRGLSPIAAAAQGIEIDLAAQKQGSKFLSGGGLVTGIIEVPETAGALDQKQKDDLRDSFRRRRDGPNGYSIGVLDGGAAFKQVMMSQSDAQYIETRKFQLEEIARLYLIPPFMVGSQEAAGVAYASSVEREQHYIDHCLVHYAGPVEAGHRRLLPGPDTYMKFNFDAFLRGSTKERYDAYAVGLEHKFLYQEDVSRLEDMDPGRAGTYLETPNNNGPKPVKPAPAAPPPPARSDTIINNHPPVFPEGFVRNQTVVNPATVEAQFALPVNNVDARTVVAEGAVVYNAGPTTPDVVVNVAAPEQRITKRTVERDGSGLITRIVETPDGE